MDTLSEHTRQIQSLLARCNPEGQRLVLGIAGPPGSGKSTLAESLVAQLNHQAKREGYAALLPMDGYHLDNDVLKARQLLHRKGAPETFDVAGLLSLVTKLREDHSAHRYPIFDRALDASLPDAGEIQSSTEVIVLEGNYLLLNAPIWEDLKSLMDVTVFLAPSLTVLEERLVQRWLDHGHNYEEAVRRAQENDLRNARLVLENSCEADMRLG